MSPKTTEKLEAFDESEFIDNSPVAEFETPDASDDDIEYEFSMDPDEIAGAVKPVVAPPGIYQLQITRANCEFTKEDAKKYPNAPRVAFSFKIINGKQGLFNPEIPYRKIGDWITLPNGRVMEVDDLNKINLSWQDLCRGLEMPIPEMIEGLRAMNFKRSNDNPALFLIGRTFKAAIIIEAGSTKFPGDRNVIAHYLKS